MKWLARGSGIAVILAALLMTACQPVRPIAAPTETLAAAPVLSAEQEAMAQASVDFVATQQGVTPESLSVVSVEAMHWPDASLGCPQPDMIYAAVITPGYQVTLEGGSERYIVHTDSRVDGEKVICAEE